MLYKRIASAGSSEALDDLKSELIDRFGPLPAATHSLFRATQLKLRAAQLGIRKIDAGATGGYLLFDEQNRIDPRRVLKLIQSRAREFKLEGPLKMRFTHEARTEEALFNRVETLLEQLA